MRGNTVRWASAVSAVALVGMGVIAAAPASAAPVKTPVHIVAHTIFDAEDGAEFESSIPGCETGTVVNGDNASAHFTPWGGVFKGDKEFTCAGGDAGFTVRLTARFSDDGSVGHWTLKSAWGDLEGVKGSGSLVGVPTDGGIDDIYTGRAR